MRDINDYTKNYNIASFEDYKVIYRRKKVLEIMQKYKPKRILEIGCGMEPLFNYIRGGYNKYVVVEPSKIFWSNANNYVKENEKIECINDFFQYTSELKQNKFDFIVCSGLLHEIEFPMVMLRDIKDISNEETIIHVNVPNANSLHRILGKEMEIIQDVQDMSERNKIYQQYRVFDMESLSEYVEKAGFNIIDKGSYFIKPFSHEQMYKMLKYNIISEKVLEGLNKLTEYIPQYASEIYVNIKIK